MALSIDEIHQALQQAAYNTMCGVGAGGGPQFTQTSLPLGAQQPLTATQLQQQYQAMMQNAPRPTVAYGLGVPLATAAPHSVWKGKSEEIIAGEIIGHRAWASYYTGSSASDPRPRLKSVAADYVWEPNKVAEGKPLDGYGIHAYKSVYHLMEDQRGSAVYGTIAMWGDVIEHEHGYRSQYARIVSLDHFGDGISLVLQDVIKKAYL